MDRLSYLPMNGQFHLDRVLDPQFTMLYGPELEHVAFLSITLLPLAHSEMITLYFLAEIPLTTPELHQRIQEHMALRFASVHSLTLEFRFAGNLPISKRTICCELTMPEKHNLKGKATHRQILQYLHRWDLYDEYPDAGAT